uniref:Uncharacterized protein n=1 Tax=uncultured prokaryote TaxID=198431 RepID=A0A0H5Q8E3_9ZZZZ|nr:hypothetical protein [uncultured prokaryote]
MWDRDTLGGMTLYRAQVHLVADSGISADIAMNTFHFDIDSATILPLSISDEDVITGQRDLGLDENGINGDLSDLYSTCSEYFASQINPGASHIKWFDLSQPSPRYPVLDLPMDSFTATGTTSIPSEVAVTCSFSGAEEAGVNMARRRNRTFLGPLSVSCIEQSNGRIKSTARSTIAGAFENFAFNSFDQSFWEWVGVSPTDQVAWRIIQGWVDDAPDTQRRRGVSPLSRSSWQQPAGVGIPFPFPDLGN